VTSDGTGVWVTLEGSQRGTSENGEFGDFGIPRGKEQTSWVGDMGTQNGGEFSPESPAWVVVSWMKAVRPPPNLYLLRGKVHDAKR